MLLENSTYTDYSTHTHLSLNQEGKIAKSELEGAVENQI